MKAYHPANVKCTPYAGWKVIALACMAKLLGVQIHVSGFPFGSAKPSYLRPTMGLNPYMDGDKP